MPVPELRVPIVWADDQVYANRPDYREIIEKNVKRFNRLRFWSEPQAEDLTTAPVICEM